MLRSEARKRPQTLPALARELRRLARITRAQRRINATMELEKISRICLRELIDMVGCDGCAIIQVEGDAARVLAERGFSDTFGPLQFTADMPAIENVVATKQAIFTGDIISSPGYEYIPYECSINSLLCSPVVVDSTVTGALYLDSVEKNAFYEEDIEFTQSMSNVIAEVFKQGYPHYEVLRNFVTDELTGCLKRTKFDRDIVDGIANAKKYYESLSVMMIGIDSFHTYHNSHGQAKSDALLKKVADILVANIRAYHEIYHYGKGEFAVLMETTSKEQASNAAIRLQRTIEQEHLDDEGISPLHGKVTASIGVATFPSDANDVERFIVAADFALFKAKKSGGNQVYVFSREK